MAASNLLSFVRGKSVTMCTATEFLKADCNKGYSMSPESVEHKRIKEIVLYALRRLYGSGLTEYPDSGNIHDIKVVTSDGIAIFVENVWSSSPTNFHRDLNILHRSTDRVKVFIVNPKIISDKKLAREFENSRMTEQGKGFQVSPMIDGFKILTDPDYVQNDFARIVDELVKAANKTQKKTIAHKIDSRGLLKHSKIILLTREDYQGLDNWAKDTVAENLILHGKDKLETKYLMQHFESGYLREIWTPLKELERLIKKYHVSRIPSIKLQTILGLRSQIESIPERDQERMGELEEQISEAIDLIVFEVKNGKPLKGRCDICST